MAERVHTRTVALEAKTDHQHRGGKTPIIVKGHIEPLEHVPFHHAAPLTRWIMASAALNPALDYYIAIHQFTDVPPADHHYCDVHVHPFDELNVFHSSLNLRVVVNLGDETIEVDAPTTVYIPAGTPHAANVVSGTGLMIAILLDGRFCANAGQ